MLSTTKDFIVSADPLTILINVLLGLTLVYAVIYYLGYLNEQRKRFRIRSGVVRKRKSFKLLDRVEFLKEMYDDLDIVLSTRGKEHISDTVFYMLMGAMGASALIFIYAQVYIMAILTPMGLAWYFKKLLKAMQEDTVVMVEKALPSAIDNLVRVSSRYSDVKSIVYETSKLVDEPLRGILDNLSRKMISSNPKEALDEFQQEYDNVWLKSIAATLISYLEDSDKESTMNNLKNLRDILSQENEGKVKLASERKYGVMINYALAVAGAIVLVLNIAFNPVGKDFFFNSFFGLICMVGGLVAVLGTVMLNVKLSKIKK